MDIVYTQADVAAFRAAVASRFEVSGGIRPPPREGGRVQPRRHMPSLLVVITFLRDQLPALSDSTAVTLFLAGINRLRQRRLQRPADNVPPLPPLRFCVREGNEEESSHSHADISTQDEAELKTAIAALPGLPARPKLEFDPHPGIWKDVE